MTRSARAGSVKSYAASSSKVKEGPFCGIDVLDLEEIESIACGGEPTSDQLRRIYGLKHRVVHPYLKEEDLKSNQKWNPNCFFGLGWKVKKKPKQPETKEFVSAIIRSPDVPYGGLKNLGATCYMNSMLQCLYFNKKFRHNIMRLSQDEFPESVRSCQPIQELQKLFANLEISCAKSFDTTMFAKSLRLDCSVQQDAQEFLKLLLTFLEQTLAHSNVPAEAKAFVEDDFRGTYSYCTKCLECGYTSRPEVSFYDLDLKVQGIATLEESLDDFIKKEDLDGENMYQCQECNVKVKAQRGIELISLPRVLNLQLLRFVFDLKSGNRRKVNTQISFPKILDLSRWCGQAKSESSTPEQSGSEKRKRRKTEKAAANCVQAEKKAKENGVATVDNTYLYELQCVIVHTGSSAIQGHYIAHVKESLDGKWWRFDDDFVTSLDDDDYLGTEEAVAKARKRLKADEAAELEGRVRSKDAYMLIYKRKEGNDKAENEVSSFIPPHLRADIEEQNRSVLPAICDHAPG
eukprot:183786-Hanusia_phi.AAC.2